MKLNRIAKKYIAICSVLLLILSLNISKNVSAKLVEDPDYGVAYDEFDDATNITSENCSLSTNGIIKLAFTETNITYDLKSKRDNIKAWMMTESTLKGLEGTLTKFLNPDLFLLSTLAYEIDDDDDLDAMAKPYEIDDDDDLEPFKTAGEIGPGAVPCWPMNLFRFEIDHDKDIIDQLEFSWRFGKYMTGTNLEGITMYAWSYGDLIPYWNYLNNATYPEGLNATNGYLTIIKKITNFISDEGIIDVLIVGKPTEGVIDVQTFLYTDYVNVKITIKEGYLSDGWVKSSFIEPDTIHGWERIFWSGSRPSANSYIKIKVLDQAKKEIPEEDLEGNSDGFTDSPIDISLLDSDKYPEIMLEALLHSEDIGFTPSLNSWGVLWQTKEGFYDSFKHDFRVDESYGVEIDRDNEEIRISEFYSDWPIFGKNPANTRAYVGTKATVGKNETYWRTSKDSDFGGGFRSPVVSNGRVYIASSDNKIYAFNLTTKYPGEVESPVNESEANYTVDASVAVTDDLVILATSNTSNISNSKSNKIYALYSTNLSKNSLPVWQYPDEDFSNPICFSSAPTIANGRVFVTSWSGIFGNNPIISYLYNKLDNLLGNTLGLNNKLFAIDINTGSLIWKDPINLPAGSFSTPAVDNGLVFVGCENMQGPSLFAFDESSGEEVWNASVGMIGRSSPVVADGKVFVLSREQSSNFTFKGNDKAFALDAETGEEIWNITLASNTSILGNMLKVYGVDYLIATFAPASTPAVYAGTLFVMSPSGIVYAFDIDTGEENWNFDAAAEIPGFDLTPYCCASPVVVDGIVYIAASESFLRERSFIFALELDNPKDGEVKVLWEYELGDPEYTELVIQQHFIFASPVVTDGLVLISERRLDIGTSTYHGRIQVIGEYKKNLMGKVYSVPIHVQKGKWWKEFNADFPPTNTTNNTVTFGILDENGNELMTGLNGTHNNISSIRRDVIQLCAELNIGNEDEDDPVLKSWEISWTPENKKPEFIDNTFEPGQEGWINLELKNCSIEVIDIGVKGIISGLNVDSAKFDLEYVSDTNEIITKTFNAVCEGESGDERVKVIAEISKLGIEIKDLKNITFKIKDLAGTENTSNIFTFKIDAEKPTSEITNKDAIKDNTFITEVIVNAKAHDPEDGSGISKVALNYRYRNSTATEWESWETFSEVPDIYNWSFGIDVTTGKPMDSGYYQIITIAKDKADNKEDVDENKIVSFLFDMKPPIMETLSGEYKSKKLPTFNLEISDDFKLDAIYYRPSSEAEWKLIIDDIDEATYSETWSLPYDIWVNMMEGEEHGIYIFFKITDWCENEYITTTTNSPLIIKDENISELYLDMSDFQERPWDNKFKISANIPDDIVVETLKLYYRYSENDEKWSEWKQYGDNLTEKPFEWEFKVKDGSGYYEFKTEIIDTSGFVYTSPVESARITLFPTTLVILMIVLIAILLAITVFVIKKMKKKKE